jgi:fibronectin type 3 domain-containing protein
LTLTVQFKPTAAGAATGKLTVTSNSSANGTAVVSLAGTGASTAQHEVDLSWDAPSSSPIPVVGYNVYRSTGGTTTYQLLNSSVDANREYVDNTVQSGVTYDYIVKSVDSSGGESSATDPLSLAIP